MKFLALLTAFIIGTAFFIFAVLLVGANLSGRKHYYQALELEADGKHADALYSLAIVIANSRVYEQRAIRKINEIWNEHGPFDDSEFDQYLNLEGLEDEFEKQDEEGGHRMMIAIIRQEIGNAKD
ncbi:MAG: hypothetical protein ACU0DI_13480 [Paracoccaceae bacterium]